MHTKDLMHTRGGPTMTDIDPQIRAVLDAMAAQPQPDEPPSLEEVRAGASGGHRALCPPLVADGVDRGAGRSRGRTVTFPASSNKPHRSDEPLPVLVYFHGGGLMLLGADEFQPLCTALAAAADCIVVNVDYRLAPEHPFPQPLDDAVAVYQWCLEHAAEIGGDASRIAVGGDSAGGYLATAVCLDAKRLGSSAADPPTARLSRHRRSEPVREHGDDRRVRQSADDRLDACRSCRRRPHQPARLPIHADDHSGLAPATILAAGHDPLVDQGRAYAAVLRASGVPVTYSCYDGTIHAFITMGGAVDVANQAVADAASALAAAFAG